MLEGLKERLGRRDKPSKRKLRRQPKMRRADSGKRFNMPDLSVPRTAKKRRRRNRTILRLPTAAVKRVLLSARWISLFILILCVLTLVFVGMNERFYLTMIPVEGAASIPPQAIIEASELAGAHIFSADPVAAADRVAAIPGVISSTVTLEWPNAATIRVREDSPVAIWEQDGELYWVNADGELTPARADVPGLLHIRAGSRAAAAEAEAPETAVGSGSERVAPEQDVDARAATGDDELAIDGSLGEEVVDLPFVPQEVLQGALQLRALRPNIDVLAYDLSGGLSYQDGRGWRVYFGTGQDMDEKLAVYETLVEHLLAEQATPAYISVSNQEKPFYMARDS